MSRTSAHGHLSGGQIELMISCTELADLDEFTKSDPMCVLFYKQFGQWKEMGRTEAIRNTLNPKFVEPFILDYDPALHQTLMFSVYDIDSRSTDLRHHDLVGSVEVALQNLLDSVKAICTTCRTLRVPGDSRARGIISISAEVIRESRDKVSLHVGGHKLKKTGKFLQSKPDVYLEISKSIDNLAFHPVYRTETICKTKHPRWRPLEIGFQRLCNGDWDRPLEFAVWHHSGSGDYKMIGRKVTTLRELKILKAKGNYQEVCLVPKKKDNHKNSVKISVCGHLRFFKIRIDCQYSLMDFIRGGMDLNLSIAIDFTYSNGKLGEKHCLHEIKSSQNNQYTAVLETLGAMIANCHKEQKIAMFGFGARTENSRKVSHCFPMSTDWDNIYVKGTQSAVDLYKTVARQVRFAGPSRLKPMLAMAESLAVKEPTQNNQAYHVLLVITDGIINDMDDVIERLISVSHLPLSVIFVGVGPADFCLMEMFNYHNVDPLISKEVNVGAIRRHTHFVSFNKNGDSSTTLDAQARDAFAILSTQIIDYMKSKNIAPNKPDLTLARSAVSGDALNDLDTEAKENARKPFQRSNSTTSYSSLMKRSSGICGPKCPTCGSVLEPGSALFPQTTTVS